MAHIIHITSVHLWRDTRIFLKMCRSLAEAGHRVSLVAIDRDATENTMLTEAGVEVHLLAGHAIRNRFNRAFKGGWMVARKAMALKGDIVHLHDPELIAHIPMLRTSGLKVIFDAHEDFVGQTDSRDWASGWRRWPVEGVSWALQQTVNRVASHIITATEKIAERHPPSKTTVINNYPIIGELQVAEEAALPLTQRPKRGIYVGGMNDIRGLREVIEALDMADNVEGFDLVGAFQSAAFHQELETLPGWRKVTHHGLCSRDEVARLMGQARFGVVTFHALRNHVEAKPNKLFEYLSAGLPVVHSHFPLWCGITQHAGVGIPVDPADAQSVAAGMNKIVDHPDLNAIAVRAVELIENELNWTQESKRLLSVIDALL